VQPRLNGEGVRISLEKKRRPTGGTEGRRSGAQKSPYMATLASHGFSIVADKDIVSSGLLIPFVGNVQMPAPG
jgi:hypothetical protein